MSILEKKIETFANVAIIIVALSILSLGGYRYFYSNSEPETIKPGTKLPLSQVNWSLKKQTLILVLQKGCHFCSESAAFYRRLLNENQIQNNTQIIAVLPDPVETSKSYLKELEVEVSEIRQSNLSSIGIRGTPTVILANQQGEIVESWVGKLNAENEEKVLQKVFCNKTEGCR